MMSPLPETPETTSLVDKLYQKIEGMVACYVP